MDIWLIRNGARIGPYPDYEIRARIEHGEMEPEEKVWHEGLAEWTPIGELELFSRSFHERKLAAIPPALPQEFLEEVMKQAVQLKPNLHLGRRFWARWADLSAYYALWWLGMYFSGRDIASSIGNLWLLMTMYLPWLAMEAFLIHRYGTTPGKWLMGLRVVNEDGSALALNTAIWRSLRVMVTGVGFGWPLLAMLCHIMSWFTARRLGKPIWDHIGNHKVIAKPLRISRIPIIVFVYLGAFYYTIAVLGPYLESEMPKDSPNYEEAKELMDQWYFPKK